MRRIIEELIEKRKKKQENLKHTLLEISNILENRSLLKKKKRPTQGKILPIKPKHQ